MGPNGLPPELEATRVDVPLGRRVMVVSDLLLTPEATPSSLAVSNELARALDTWDGPGILIIAGNLFDLTGSGSALTESQQSLEAHPALNRALSRFLEVAERRVIRQTGTHEPGLEADPERVAVITAKGVEQRRSDRPPPPHGQRGAGGAGRTGRTRLCLGAHR